MTATFLATNVQKSKSLTLLFLCLKFVSQGMPCAVKFFLTMKIFMGYPWHVNGSWKLILHHFHGGNNNQCNEIVKCHPCKKRCAITCVISSLILLCVNHTKITTKSHFFTLKITLPQCVIHSVKKCVKEMWSHASSHLQKWHWTWTTQASLHT